MLRWNVTTHANTYVYMQIHILIYKNISAIIIVIHIIVFHYIL